MAGLAGTMVCGVVRAESYARAKKFYTDVLGLKPGQEFPGPGGGGMFEAAGGTMLMVYENAGSTRETLALAERALALLRDGKPARLVERRSEEERVFHMLGLLTALPVLPVVETWNVLVVRPVERT